MKFSEKEAICRDWKESTIKEMHKKGCSLVLVIESKERIYHSGINDPVANIQIKLDQEGIRVDVQRQPKDLIIGIIGYSNHEYHKKIQHEVFQTAKDFFKAEKFKVIPHINPNPALLIGK